MLWSIHSPSTNSQLYKDLSVLLLSHVLNGCVVNALSLSLSGFHSSDSEGHFDTPEAATPVRALPTFPGELENSHADPEKTGEASAEQIPDRERKDKARKSLSKTKTHCSNFLG